jgi:DNA-binding NarL/FixJ family response regulator
MITRINIYSEYSLYGISLKYLLTNVDRTEHDVHIVNDLVSDYFTKTQLCILNLGNKNSSEARQIVENILIEYIDANLIVVGEIQNVDFVMRLFQKGVKPILSKEVDDVEFIDAVNQVKLGKIYLSSMLKTTMLDRICNVKDEEQEFSKQYSELTSREKEILKFIGEGKSSKEISNQLFISTHTVDTHRRNIMQKLNLNSNSRLMKFIYENNIHLM